MVSRRRFLFLVGTTSSGLWLGGAGFLQLKRHFVLSLGGSCSFCGKAASEVKTLAGVVARPARICDECVGLCCEILAESTLRERPGNEHEHEREADQQLVADELNRLIDDLQRESETGIDRLLAELRSRIDGRRSARVSDFECSFCGTHRREAAKLISGPRVFICDACVGDAAAIASNVLRGHGASTAPIG